jgi:hypothetical protein
MLFYLVIFVPFGAAINLLFPNSTFTYFVPVDSNTIMAICWPKKVNEIEVSCHLKKY